METIDHNEYVNFELEITTFEFIRTAKSLGYSDEEILIHLEQYLGAMK